MPIRLNSGSLHCSQKLGASIACAMLLASSAFAQQPDPGQNPNLNNHEYSVHKYAIGGKKTQLHFIHAVKADCTPVDWFEVTIISDPEHGVASLVDGTAFPYYVAPNPRVRCNDKRVRGKFVEYTPVRGYTGSDELTVEAIGNNGDRNVWKYELTVRP